MSQHFHLPRGPDHLGKLSVSWGESLHQSMPSKSIPPKPQPEQDRFSQVGVKKPNFPPYIEGSV